MPWSAPDVVIDPNREYVAHAGVFVLPHYKNCFTIFRQGLQIFEQLESSEGIVSHDEQTSVSTCTVEFLTVWENERSLRNFATTGVHATEREALTAASDDAADQCSGLQSTRALRLSTRSLRSGKTSL
eukprot:gnl/Hemi2/26696_TR8970_c0_g1_i1.p2 gnl/Hemi2/26696_TR8970_c0_g1~~gnl/Hemi2/26696_TR8970_c0_g1_i1.p2  ORF type:complete len:128 (+),score=10.59 gnl/Hemi2/26696_TR8970_c0_g1_i1:45-428(+)